MYIDILYAISFHIELELFLDSRHGCTFPLIFLNFELQVYENEWNN